MEIQLQELIEQIKKDGIETAETKADSIIQSANEQAEKIIADAKAEAEKILAKAKEDNAKTVRAGEDSIRQAGRNLLLSFRESVVKELNSVTGARVAEAYSPDVLVELIPKAVQAWAGDKNTDDITVLLNSKDLEKLENSLLSSLKEKMMGGVTLKPNDTFNGGFRIASCSGGVYYDYSADAVTEMLSAYLNPNITAIMKEADK